MAVALRLSRGGSKKDHILELSQPISVLLEMVDIWKDLELTIQ